MTPKFEKTTVGSYGQIVPFINISDPPELSFRRGEFRDIDLWRKSARGKTLELMAPPPYQPAGDIKIHSRRQIDGVNIELLSWANPFGPRTEAAMLTPAGATGPLPAVLGLHEHGGKKFHGFSKIVDLGPETATGIHKAERERLYSGRSWANELCKRGYAVLVHDAFAFGNRRVNLADVIDPVRGQFSDQPPAGDKQIEEYNTWAASHEAVMAKAMFSAGTTWPGVFFSDDRRALDYLCSRSEVDAERIACCGHSGGGLRASLLGGLDDRIACAICVGMTTTWRDFALNKCWISTWMTYIPHLPRLLDFPEILALRAPLPTMTLNNFDDQLFTVPEMRRADEMQRTIFAKANAAENFASAFYPGRHKFDLQMQHDAFEWLDKHLK